MSGIKARVAKRGKKKVAAKAAVTTSRKKTPQGESGSMGLRTLFRPERAPYILGKAKSDGCVFCIGRARGVGVETLLVHQTEHTMIFINKFPYNPGHILVLPRGHIGRFQDLTIEMSIDLHETLRRAVDVIETSYRPAGVNVGLNLGKAAGAGIPDHLHYHVIPRWAGDLNFFPLIASSKAIIETLDQTYARLRIAFQK